MTDKKLQMTEADFTYRMKSLDPKAVSFCASNGTQFNKNNLSVIYDPTKEAVTVSFIQNGTTYELTDDKEVVKLMDMIQAGKANSYIESFLAKS